MSETVGVISAGNSDKIATVEGFAAMDDIVNGGSGSTGPDRRVLSGFVGGRPWQPGQSGNPAGRPIGSRQKIAEAIIRDIAAEWERSGAGVLERMARDEPAKFAQLAAGLVPKDILLSVTQRVPGGLDPDDWGIALSVFAAIKEALPDASSRSPAQVLQFVLDAIRGAGAKQIEG
jgi:hypothetical protein